MMFSRRSATALCAFFAFLLFLRVTPSLAAPGQEGLGPFTPLSPPVPLPALLVKDLNGRPQRLIDLVAPLLTNHRLVVLHLWAPNCPPCAVEIKEIDELLPSLDKKGVAILALAQDPHGAVTLPAFIRRRELRLLPLYIDENLSALKALMPRGLPDSFLIDSKGRIVAAHEGALDWTRLSF